MVKIVGKISFRCRRLFRHRRSVSLVFTLGRREDCLHPRRQAAVEIAGLETRRDLLVNDAFAKRIGQDAFQSVADFNEHLVVLDENEKHRPVVFALLPHLPRPRHAHGVILNGRVRLHLRERWPPRFGRKLWRSKFSSVWFNCAAVPAETTSA